MRRPKRPKLAQGAGYRARGGVRGVSEARAAVREAAVGATAVRAAPGTVTSMETATDTRDVLLVDLAALRLVRTGRVVVACLPGGEELTRMVLPDGVEGRAAVAAVLERLLDGRVGLTRSTLRGGKATTVRYRLGLYNPHTAQVALGAGSPAAAVSVGRRLAIGADGTPARLDAVTGGLQLEDGTVAGPAGHGPEPLLRALEAHRQGELAVVA